MSSHADRANEPPPLTAEQRERLIRIWRSCCGALQTVVTDLKITQDELKLAGQFFNRLGQSGMFPSLLAVGLSMTSMRVTEGFAGTPPNLEGPYHVPNAPIRKDGVLWEKPLSSDARYLELSGVVRDSGNGKPLANVELDFWQADDDGIYDNVGYHLRGRVLTDAEGRYTVRSIVPKDYSEHDHDPIGELFRAMDRHNRRAAHIHLKVRREGYLPLTTQLYMPDGAYLHSDYVEGAVLPELIVNFEDTGADQRKVVARFDLAITPTAAANAA
jgi:protocatechuate 3,4-dioxygenase beta subunit